MRIVFFTNKSTRGAEILKHLAERDIHLEAIFIDVEKRRAKNRLLKVKKTHNRIGFVETIKIIYKRARKKWTLKPKAEWKSNEFYYSFADKIHLVNSFNGKHCERLLRQIEPDVIVLGGSRIIRKNIIQIPTIGILNAHPGLLPKYRGVDVIPWAIFHGDSIGVTIHFIDEGVDTGAIVAQESMALKEGDTLGKLMKRANRLAGKLMAESVFELVETGKIQRFPQSKEKGQQFYRMPLNLRQETEEKLKVMIEESGYVGV